MTRLARPTVVMGEPPTKGSRSNGGLAIQDIRKVPAIKPESWGPGARAEPPSDNGNLRGAVNAKLALRIWMGLAR